MPKTIDLVRAQIKESFEQAVFSLQSQGIDGGYRTFKNADGSIDSELSIRNLPRGYTAFDAFIDLETAFVSVPGTWVSTAVRLDTIDIAKSPLDVRIGMLQVDAHQALNFIRGRDIVDRLKERQFHKPIQVVIRVHWNPSHKRPIRETGRES